LEKRKIGIVLKINLVDKGKEKKRIEEVHKEKAGG
jgi:hypothetical protein